MVSYPKPWRHPTVPPPRGPSAGYERPSRPFGLRSLTRTRAIKRPNEKSPANCGTLSNSKNENLELSPDHLIDDAGVTLDNLHDLGTDVFIDVVRHGDAVVAVGVHRYCGINSLQERLFVDAGDKEAGLVERFGAFGAGADAHSRERVADAREEGAFFGQGAAVAHDGKGVHLQAVIVMESEGFVLNHALVELEAACSQTVSAARVAAVKNRHIILFGHLVDGSKEAREVLLGVDILFAVGAQQNIFALFKAQTLVNVTGLNCRQILMQDFGHGAARHVRTFLGESAVGQIAACVFGVGHIHIADDIDDATVGLFGQAFVLAAVTGFHVENRDMQTLSANSREAAVRVTENQQGIGLAGDHQLVATIDDVPDGSAKVITHGIHVNFRILEVQVLEEHAVQVVVIILASVRQDAVEVLAALVDDGGQADDFGARTHDNQEFQLAVVGKFHVAVVCLDIHYFTTFSPKVSGWFGSKDSLAHMTVTRFSVSDKLIMLCV